MSRILDLIIKPEEADMDLDSILPDDLNNMDIPLNFDNTELMSSDFFDSVLSMEKQNMIPLEDDFLNLNYEMNSNEDAVQSPIHGISSDNGSLDSDHFDLNSSRNLSFNNNDAEEIKIEEGEICWRTLLEQQDIQKNINDILGINAAKPKVVIQKPNNSKKVFVSKPVTSGNKKKLQVGNNQVIRVQSITGNGRSLLLPVNVKNVKKFKIINANDLKGLPATCHQVIKKVEQYAASTSSESVDEIDVDIENLNSERSYPALELTAEEKRLLMKEGIKLPSHYPLTKHEEKELKRIRRKIRNKISAQDSRKRKKEYVDQLEEKARRTDQENEFLKKRVKILNKENTRLHEQLKKLQELLFSSSSKATPTTCLMIVLFSTLLVCLPNLRTANNKDLDIGEQQLVTSARRALLFNQPSKEDDEGMHLDEFLVFNKDEVATEVHFEDEEKENGTSAFIKYLGDLSKKYEALIRSNCTEILQGGSLQEFCRKHEEEFKMALQNLRSLMGQGNIEEKKFIEPDISDGEGDTPVFKHHNAYLLDDDDPPTKKIRLSREDVDYDKSTHESVVEMNTETKSLPLKRE